MEAGVSRLPQAARFIGCLEHGAVGAAGGRLCAHELNTRLLDLARWRRDERRVEVCAVRSSGKVLPYAERIIVGRNRQRARSGGQARGTGCQERSSVESHDFTSKDFTILSARCPAGYTPTPSRRRNPWRAKNRCALEFPSATTSHTSCAGGSAFAARESA